MIILLDSNNNIIIDNFLMNENKNQYGSFY